MMIRSRGLLVVLSAGLLGGCSSRAVRPKAVLLCRGQSCETVSDAASRERLLTGLHALLREAKGKELPVYSADRATGGVKKQGISFFVQGGPIPGRSTVSDLTVKDVVYIDRANSEIKARVQISATYVAVPLLCSESAAVFTVTSERVGLKMSNVCTWIAAAVTGTNFDFLFDRLDLETGELRGNWSARTSGLPVIGGGSGYMSVRLRPASPPTPAPKPEPKPEPAPVKKIVETVVPTPAAEAVEIVSQAVELKLSTRFTDEDGDLLLKGGEQITLSVDVQNVGKALAANARVALSGENALVKCLGESKTVGGVIPGETEAAEFKCRLPAQLPTGTVDLRLTLTVGAKNEVAATKLLRLGVKPPVAAAEETISELSVDDIPAKIGGATDNVALVIGLTRYREKTIPAVKYAARDAEVVARYLENVAGVSPNNLKVLTDDAATKSDLEAYVDDWLPRRVTPQSTVIVYYSGHGTPDAAGKEGFIVPYEGQADFPTKLYPLKRLYEALAKLPAKAVVVLLDSCFSGAKGRGIAKEGARPLVVASDNAPAAGGKVVVIAGATGAQIASDFDRVEHGLFTYYLLKGLRGEADADRDGIVNVGEVFKFVGAGVTKTASVELNRDQTPVLLGEAAANAQHPVARALR